MGGGDPYQPCRAHLGGSPDPDCTACRITCRTCEVQQLPCGFPRDAEERIGRRTRCLACRFPADSRELGRAVYVAALGLRGIHVRLGAERLPSWGRITERFDVPAAWASLYALAWRGVDVRLMDVGWRFEFATVPSVHAPETPAQQTAWMRAVMDPRNIRMALLVEKEQSDASSNEEDEAARLTCKACKLAQPPFAFHLAKKIASGRSTKCRVCACPAKSEAVVSTVYAAATRGEDEDRRWRTWMQLQSANQLGSGVRTLFGVWKDLDFAQQGVTWEFRFEGLGPCPPKGDEPVLRRWTREVLDPERVSVCPLVS